MFGKVLLFGKTLENGVLANCVADSFPVNMMKNRRK